MAQRKKRRSRAKDPGGLPKGAWPLPDGGYALAGPPWNHHGQDIRIVGVRRHPSAAEVARLIIGGRTKAPRTYAMRCSRILTATMRCSSLT